MKNVISLLLSLVAVIAAFISCGGDKEMRTYNSGARYDARFFRGSYQADEYGFIPCENADTLYVSSVAHIPVQKIDSRERLADFEENISASSELAEYVEAFDENFFEENILLAAYIESGSGSYRYYLSNMYIENGGLTLGISQKLMPPDICVTCDMAYWIVLVEVKRDKISDVEIFDAIYETRHSYYDVQGDFYSPMLTLDENSSEGYFVYFADESRREIYGYFKASDKGLVLTSENGEEKIAFSFEGDDLVFDAENTVSESVSFVDGKTVLKKLR